jgi:hypothetical protein
MLIDPHTMAFAAVPTTPWNHRTDALCPGAARFTSQD